MAHENPVEYVLFEDIYMLTLNEEQVRALLTMEELIPEMERAFQDFSSGKLRQPVRSVLRLPEHQGILGLMPAVDGELMGIKLVTIYEENARAGLPTHQAVIQLFRAATGELLVTMDGRLITEMRTAAASAVAIRLLAPPEAKVLAILGSGVQARSHIEALRLVRDFREVRVWSRTPEHARQFASQFGAQAMALEEAVRGADVVVSVAATHEPMVRGAWLGEKTLVVAVGAVGPEKRELDDVAMDASIVVESREAAMRESGDILGSGAAVYAELGELLNGTLPMPPAGKRIVYKSLGIAAEDVAAAGLVLKKWQNSGAQAG